MSHLDLLKKHMKYVLPLVGFWSIYIILGISCPIKRFLGVPCPTCGTTRALFALMQGDFQRYVYYQPMAVFLVIDVIIMFHIRILKYKTAVISGAVMVLILNLVIYIYRYV